MMRGGGPGASSGGAVAVLIVGCLLSGAGASRAPSESEAQTVEQLEAALVLTLARFVEWPAQAFPSAAAPIVAGIMADDGVALALETGARGKNVAGRSLTVRRVHWDGDVAGLHMLVVGEREQRRLALVLAGIRTLPIVTISRLPDFGRAGGMITLAFTDGRVSFAVNSSATALSGVRLSSFLLSHATRVSDDSPGGAR
jgi:hypothetical protein